MSVIRLAASAIPMFVALGIAGTTGAAQAPRGAALEAESAAKQDSTLRIIISVARRTLWVVNGASDTMLTAPVAVGSERSLAYGGHRWTFRTPRGVHTVLAKEESARRGSRDSRHAGRVIGRPRRDARMHARSRCRPLLAVRTRPRRNACLHLLEPCGGVQRPR